MTTLLVYKERLRNIYQKYDLYIEPSIKFIVAFIVFTLINQNIGYDTRLKNLPVVIIISLLGAFTPSSILVLLAALVTIGHVFKVSSILAVIIVLIIFILYFMLVRFTPKQGYIVLAVPILFLLKIPYVIPILMGVVSVPLSIVPVSCGIIVYFLFNVVKAAALIKSNTTVEDTLTLYKYVIDSLISNKIMMLTIFAFAVVILVTYFVRRLKIDHAFDIAILTGAVVNVLIFLVGDLKFNNFKDILFMIVGTVMSAIIVYIIQFFRLTLEYTAVERVQFEDEDYYYYVKAVPKMKVTPPEKNVKRINISHNTTDISDIQNEFNLKNEFDIEEDFTEGFDNQDIFDK